MAAANGSPPGTVLHLWGVVSWFRPARKSGGTDYVCQLTVVDKSVAHIFTGGDQGGLKCNIFQRSEQQLPQHKRVGDIVRLHRVKVGALLGSAPSTVVGWEA